jgi:hypothetical protein
MQPQPKTVRPAAIRERDERRAWRRHHFHRNLPGSPGSFIHNPARGRGQASYNEEMLDDE